MAQASGETAASVLLQTDDETRAATCGARSSSAASTRMMALV